MGILDSPEHIKKLLEIIPEESIRDKLTTKWADKSKSASEKWDMLVKEDGKAKRKFKDNVARDIMFQYCYPRLDTNVTIGMNHLLKSPFCVHPKTRKYFFLSFFFLCSLIIFI
jgi:DNA primase small subunit